MNKPRDNQRQRLYNAERAFENSNASRAALKYLANGKKVDSTGNVSIESCQSYIDYVLTSSWFQSRWGQKKMTAIHKTYGGATASNGWTGARIALPPWARTEWVMLHEIAHHLTPNKYAVHGPEFAGVLLTLVRYQMGVDRAKSLRESYKAHRVRYSLKAVPKARTATKVVPRTEVAAKTRRAERERAVREKQEREAALALRQRRLVEYTSRHEAAESIRACVKAGMFGPSGSKPRVHALATARAMERGGSR